jgi:hypothetical protein
MCTVLITYSTPPPPPDIVPAASFTAGTSPGAGTDATVGPDTSFAATTAGIDEAIAASIADELARAGHRVTCRPSVATTSTEGYELVVSVDHLHVSHWSGRPSMPVRPTEPPGAGPAAGPEDGRSTIPMTWCADWRAVDAWARSVGDHLAHFLELRTELARVRAELDRCRAMLRAVTPEPRPVSAIELGRPVGRDTFRVHRPQHLASAGPTSRT